MLRCCAVDVSGPIRGVAEGRMSVRS